MLPEAKSPFELAYEALMTRNERKKELEALKARRQSLENEIASGALRIGELNAEIARLEADFRRYAKETIAK